MEQITSRSNNFIVFLSSLHDRKNRDREGLFIFEGKKLFNEAVKRQIPVQAVVFTEENIDFVNKLCSNVRKILVSQSVYEKISCEKSPSGVFCLSKGIDKFHKFATIYNKRINGSKIILDSLRDPGNLGTVIRTASALGIGEIILSKDCADIYSEKTVRASMGALFSQNITICDDLCQAIDLLKSERYKVYAAALSENSKILTDIECSEKTIFVVGNEGHGISADVLSHCDKSVIIPMPGGTESLNASIAAAILMWECTVKSSGS